MVMSRFWREWGCEKNRSRVPKKRRRAQRRSPSDIYFTSSDADDAGGAPASYSVLEATHLRSFRLAAAIWREAGNRGNAEIEQQNSTNDDRTFDRGTCVFPETHEHLLDVDILKNADWKRQQLQHARGSLASLRQAQVDALEHACGDRQRVEIEDQSQDRNDARRNEAECSQEDEARPDADAGDACPGRVA